MVVFMTLSIKRGVSYKSFSILEAKKVISVSLEDLRTKTGAYDLVRIPEDEYPGIDASKKFFTHFNLEDTDVIPKNIYLLPKIISTGFFDHLAEEGKEPILSFEDIFITKCVSVKNNLAYKDIDPKAFEFSMKYIKDIPTLKQAILKRYSKSMPRLSKEEIEKLGVAIATHEIIGRKSFRFLPA